MSDPGYCSNNMYIVVGHITVVFCQFFKGDNFNKIVFASLVCELFF